MFEPLQELLLAFKVSGRTSLSSHAALGNAVLEDKRLLGEKDGRLYGSSEEAEYVACGGALYPPQQLANKAVVGWGYGETGDADGQVALRRRATARGGPRGLLGCLASVCVTAPRRVARLVLCTAAYLLPALRMAFPTAVPHPSLRRQLLAVTSSAAPERITAMAFHPYQMVVALAIDEGGADGSARVTVYDVMQNRVMVVLTHAFQRDVQSLAWKPWSRDVLAVGCRGGVLLWSVNGGGWGGADGTSAAALGARDAIRRFGYENRHPAAPNSEAAKVCISAKAGESAFALFYRCSRGMPVTTMDFSKENGRYLACGSRWTAQLHVLDVSYGPQEAASALCRLVPSVEGGSELVVFSDDDSFVFSAVAGAPYMSFIRVNPFPYTSTTVAVPAPVLQMVEASGIGPNYYFLYTSGLEGVIVARVNGFIGVEVVSLVSTGICRGVGGTVRCIAASKRRLWIALETGHLLVAYYNCREGHFNLFPIGVAATNAYLLADFPGCPVGSLVGMVERDGTVSFLPSYHI